MDEASSKNIEKKIQVIFIITLIIISVIAATWLTAFYIIEYQGPTEPVLTTTFSSISPQDALGFINSSNNPVIIVDCRSCKCNYNKGHLINATWNINPQSFYNETSDMLVYDNTGEACIEFCENLTGHIYGAIYYIEGGINAWQSAGYEVIT